MLKQLSTVFLLSWMAYLTTVVLTQNILINSLITPNQEQFNRQDRSMMSGLRFMRMERMKAGGVLTRFQLLCLITLLTRSLFVVRMVLLEHGYVVVPAVGA